METELKLELDLGSDMAELPVLLGLEPGRREQLDSIYFDTADERLARAGFSLRIRNDGRQRIQTIKSGGGTGAGLFARDEWEYAVERDEPQIPSDGPLARFLNGAVVEIAPRYTVHVARETWLIDQAGAQIELALDQGSANAGDSSAPICEIELELKDGPPAALFALARRIGGTVPVRIGTLSKAERGQRLRERTHGAGAEKAGAVPLTPEMTVAEGFRAIAFHCIRHFRANEDDLRAHDEVDALHQARVAIRRLRSALVAFKPVVKGAEAKAFNADLRWLAAMLGAARDIDVLLPRIGDPQAVARLEEERGVAYARARRACASERARRLWLDMVEWLTLGDWAERKRAHKPLPAFAGKAIGRLHDMLLAEAQAVIGDDDEARHEARKTAKKLRYTVEFFEALHAHGHVKKARKRYLAPLKELQEHLGDLNDIAAQPATFATLGLDTDLAPAHDRRSVLILNAGDALRRLEDAERYWD